MAPADKAGARGVESPCAPGEVTGVDVVAGIRVGDVVFPEDS